MGCGSSRGMNRAEAKCNFVLAMHLSAILGIEAGSADILRYVARLRLEGCDGPDDFDELASTVDDLSGGPFHFKRFHLTKVTRFLRRKQEIGWKKDAPRTVREPIRLDGPAAFQRARGRCSLCGFDVFDTQPRLRDHNTGLYQHEDCLTSNHTVPEGAAALAESSVLDRVAIENARISVEDVDANVEAIMTAAHAAHADAKRQAEVALAQAHAQANAAQVKAAAAPARAGQSTSAYKSSFSGRASNVAEGTISATLAAHLSTLIGIDAASKDIGQYVIALRSEGCETADDFGIVELDTLKEEPYNFKQFHLLKLKQARRNEAQQNNVDTSNHISALLPLAPPPNGSGTARRLCSLCNRNILDTHQMRNDLTTDRYQHETCAAAADAARAEVFATAKRKALVDAAAEAARSEVLAVASRQAEADAEAEVQAAVVKAATAAAHAELEATHRAEAALTRANEVTASLQRTESATAAALAARTAKQTSTEAATMGNDRGSSVPFRGDNDTASVGTSEPTLPQPSNGFNTRVRKPMLPAAPKTKKLLPNGMHAFLSYQWDVQEQVKEIKGLLNERNVRCWMDIDGGMKSDIYDSMAEGVQGAACLICFMTQAYQDSVNCKLELKFAQQSGVPIIPVMMQANFTAKGWLAILTAGSIWTPMHDSASVLDGIDNLIVQARHVVPGTHVDDGDTYSEGSSEAGSSFDVGAWGDAIFSLEETRDELERLREEVVPSASTRRSAAADESGVSLCPLPAMVPSLPRGLFVTEKMQSVLNAVLADTSTPQIGFCGMGGIGKTTVSSWVARNDAARTKFGMVAWITLGQTPVISSCADLLHQQLTGAALQDGVSTDQKNEFLQQAFLNQSVLLILDDCWDADVANHFNWIDANTNSKILLSSRIRNVLDGGEIIDVTVPSKMDAVKMLLSTAGMDVGALQGFKEVAHIAELCKRLPLTIGVAGKLIRQLAQGSKMTAAREWTEVVTLLEEELTDPDGSMSIEESVIRASIKAIPTKLKTQCTRLFTGFGLVPEDTFVPLSVLGLVFDACVGTTGEITKPLSRLQIRRYLKVLIDRSLVLGTVDRPQLHDVMLDYVKKQLTGEPCKEAQRRLVEGLRKSNRSRATPTGKYIQQCVKHHVTESYDEAWGVGAQAISWIEDRVSGVQDVIASSAASVVPVEVLAQEAEAAEMWWQAALRWAALGLFKVSEGGNNDAGVDCFKLAVNASAKAAVAVRSSSSDEAGVGYVTQSELDLFDMNVLNIILKSWDPANTQLFGERYRLVCATEAGQSQPLLSYSAILSLDWFPALLRGSQQAWADESWALAKYVLELCSENNQAYARTTEENRNILQPMMAYPFVYSGDAINATPGFSWDALENGDKLMTHYYSYEYEEHHGVICDLCGNDNHLFAAEAWILTVQFGRIEDSKRMLLDDYLPTFQKIVSAGSSSAGYTTTVVPALSLVPCVASILGLSEFVRRMFAILGIHFDNVEEKVNELTEPARGGFYNAMEQKGGGGIASTKRVAWNTKVMCILHLDVPESKSIAWLESLPDNEEYYAISMTFPTHNSGGICNFYAACWIALAHEKVGLYEGAIRFADLQLEPDLLKAGTPLLKWPQVIALACKARVFATLNRHDEALAAFQAAIAMSQGSFSLIEAFAFRELATYAEGGDAAVQASVDLTTRLDTFKGQMSKAEFDTLKISP